ncbi:MAG: TerC family protein [Rhodoblastus sp.]|nr:MAG: TerC family protein [Rhodoblastus sp.]
MEFSFLFADWLGKPLWLWGAFGALVLTLLVFDLGVLNRGSKEIGVGRSLALSAFYIAAGVAFGGYVWSVYGSKAGVDYLTGFALEKTLALDNIFVIATIFAYFGVPRAYQHRVLVYGILGVIVLRALLIGAGTAIVMQFHWVLYGFAVLLVVTGVKMAMPGSASGHDLSANPVLKMLRRRFNVTEGLHGERFFVTLEKNGRRVRHATPLFLALVMIELADLVFAIDSVPAVLAITTDPFIVYTSNIFAILGLRALYFALSAMTERFAYLKYALAAVLVFIGGKILVADMLGLGKVPPLLSLSVTLGLLVAGVVASLVLTRDVPKGAGEADERA